MAPDPSHVTRCRTLDNDRATQHPLHIGRRTRPVPGTRRAHNPNHEDTTMAKGIEPKRPDKKKPAKTMKEKRADKKAKKDAKR